jgi:CHAD domain-containing protein
MSERVQSLSTVRSGIEREIKLAVDATFRLPPLKGTRLPTKILTAIYYDTPDLRLARSRITLRRRTEGRKTRWQLKLPLDCGRRELEMPGGTSPPSVISDALFIHLQGADMGPVATMRTRRTGIRVGGSKHGADVVLDEVSVLKGRSEVLKFWEVEIEQLNSNPRVSDTLESLLRKAGASDHDGRPKVFHALNLPAPSPPVSPRSHDSDEVHLSYMLTRQLDSILSHDPGMRVGGESEDVHQMRVAIRRMRSILRVARPLVEVEWAESLRQHLNWLGRRLGMARDLDVQITYFQNQENSVTTVDRAGLEQFIAYLQKKRTKVQHELVGELRRSRYVKLVNRLTLDVRQPHCIPHKTTLQELAGKAFRKLCKAVKNIDVRACSARWHCVRILAKRARYAAELSAPRWGQPATRFIEQIKNIQDYLGEIQDAVIAENILRRYTSKARGRRSTLLAGQMVERQHQRQYNAKKAFFSTWKDVRKCGQHLWP